MTAVASAGISSTMGGTMKRLVMSILLTLLAAALLAPAALADSEYPPWMSAATWPRPEWSGYPIVDTSAAHDPDLAWFEIHRLRPNVYAIYEPGNWQEVMSYLFIGRHKAMLYDTGMNIGDIKHATDFLTDLPVFVVNSHFHPDHTGCNFEYDDVWAMRDRFARMFQGGWAKEDVAGFLTDAMWPEWGTPPRFDPATYCIPPYTITHWLKDGDVIDLGNRKFEVIRTPGHSTDGTCLLDRAHRLLLVGDVWYNGQLGVNDLQGVYADRGEARQSGVQGRLHPAQPQLHDDLVPVAAQDARRLPSHQRWQRSPSRDVPGRRCQLLRLRLLQRVGPAQADPALRRITGIR